MKYLDIQKVFVFKNDRKFITIMLPITDKDKELAIETIREDVANELSCGMTITEKRILLLGDPSTITTTEAKKLEIISIGYFIIEDYKTRQYRINDNGFPSVTEYHDPVTIIKLASSMIGNPKEAIILKMTYDSYRTSKFYNVHIKHISHGKD